MWNNMLELTTPFIISQIIMLIAMWSDFLGMQLKKRKHIFLAFIVSASLISIHYFLLDKTMAWVITMFSVIRFVTCYFTTDKKYMYLFLLINTVVLITTYAEIYDLILYVWLFLFIVWNFQVNDKKMRLLMMSGTTLVMIYNIFIFSPMWVAVEWSFLVSHILGYYRYHIRKWKKNKATSCIVDQ